jgi:hypothetical protein
MNKADQIRHYVDAQDYATAVRLSIEVAKDGQPDGPTMEAARYLTAALRSKCMGLAARKMDFGPEYETLERLLREANAVTGQDMYGRTV